MDELSLRGTDRIPPSSRRSPVITISYCFSILCAAFFLQTSQHLLLTRNGIGFSLMKSSIYADELITSWIFGLGSPAELQQHRKLIACSHFGYRSLSSFRFACLSSASAYSSAILRGMFFFCTDSSPLDMIFETKGSPYLRVACTIPSSGRTVSISTPYFLAVSMTCCLIAFISNPVLKNTYFTGGKANVFLTRSIKSIIISLSLPPEYEHIAFGCKYKCFAMIDSIAINFLGASKSAYGGLCVYTLLRNSLSFAMFMPNTPLSP